MQGLLIGFDRNYVVVALLDDRLHRFFWAWAASIV